MKDLRHLDVLITINTKEAVANAALAERKVKEFGTTVGIVSKSLRQLESESKKAFSGMERAAKLLSQRIERNRVKSNKKGGILGANAEMFGFGGEDGFQDREKQFTRVRQQQARHEKTAAADRKAFMGRLYRQADREQREVEGIERRAKQRDNTARVKANSKDGILGANAEMFGFGVGNRFGDHEKQFDDERRARTGGGGGRGGGGRGSRNSNMAGFFGGQPEVDTRGFGHYPADRAKRPGRPAPGRPGAGRFGTQLGGASMSAGFALGGMSYGLMSAASALTGYGTALAAQTAQTAAFGREVKINADVLGVTTTEYQELTYAAKKYGTEMTKIQDVMIMLSARSEQAQNGNKTQINNFGMIGISADQLKGKSPAQLLYAVGAAMKNTTDHTKRLAAAQQLLGNANAKVMLPLMIKGFKEAANEAHRLGIILSEEDMVKTELFTEKLNKLTQRTEGLGKEISLDLMPALGDWADVFDRIEEVLMPFVDGLDLRLLPVLGAVTVAILGVSGAVAGLAATVLLAMPVFTAFAALLSMLGLVSGPIGWVAMALAGVFTLAVLAAAAATALFVGGLIGLALALEDIYVYSQGGESAIGSFIAAFATSESTLGSAAKLLKEVLRIVIYGFQNTDWNNVFSAFKKGVYEGIIAPLKTALWLLEHLLIGSGVKAQLDIGTAILSGNTSSVGKAMLGPAAGASKMLGGMTPQMAGNSTSNRTSSNTTIYGDTYLSASEVPNAASSLTQMNTGLQEQRNRKSISPYLVQ